MNNILKLIEEFESNNQEKFKELDDISFLNSKKVLTSFRENNVNALDFCGTNGYGYDDIGRDKIERIFADILGGEDALVRPQLISGTHALTVCFFGLLRPGDTLLSINGKPYDTLDEVIGLRENPSSLKAFQVKYDQIALVNNDFDYNKIAAYLKTNPVKVIEIQRSVGYANRDTIDIEKIAKVCKVIKEISPKTIIMVDNCYCEFVDKVSPIEMGADIIVGSLIKNLGGGIAPNGAYIAGRKDLVELAAERLTVPGEGKGVGPTLGINRSLLQGLFLAPSVVKASIKTAILTSKVMEMLGYKVEPRFDAERVDIVQTIEFGDREKLIKYCQGIQAGSPVDSDSLPEPCDTPGYQDQIIMASGSFTQGSSIELSCDGPLRAPFVGFQQGALTYEYGKLGLIKAIAQ